jgi:two-component system response regulator PilR (NtrC family)
MKKPHENQLKVLVVDDERSMQEFFESMLQREGYYVECADDGKDALEFLKAQEFNLVIADIRMKRVDGLELLRKCKLISPSTVVIMISAYASKETAVEAMNGGAFDYLSKPFNLDEMRSAIENALQKSRGDGRERKHKDGPLHYGCLMGNSPPMQKVYDLINRIAATSSNVLITGESGTGKELVAKAIHRQSPRRNYPFITVNCGGVPETLIESELFGYKKGSFTGATSSHKGLVEAAQGGTLFLDEIGEVSQALQVKLLRLVQGKTIKMIGGTEDILVDVRIISATNRNLEAMVVEGTFREDLYFRLNVLPIRLPPLRDRREDISVLAEYFLTKFSRAFGKDIRKISSYAMEILKNYEFPGNVRELENIVERGVALESSSFILPDSLTLANFKKVRMDPSGTRSGLPPSGSSLDDYLAEIEVKMIEEALQKVQGVKHKAAGLLGISFRSLRYRLLKYGLASGDN